MKHKIVKHQFFFFSLLLFAVALLLRTIFVNEEKNQIQYANSVEKKVNSELSIIENDLNAIARHIQEVKEFSFTNLHKETKYPYYIFSRGNLVYWSDFKMIPAYNSIVGDYKFRYINLRGGQFVSHKRVVTTANTQIEIFSFLPIVSQNKIDNSYIASGFNTDIFPNTSLVIKAFSSPGDVNIETVEGDYLFSIDFLRGFEFNPLASKLLVVGLLTASIICMLIYISQQVRRLVRKRRRWQAFFFLSFSLGLVRALMLVFDFPFAITEVALFNSRYFASSIFNPSLGDLLLNNLLLFVLVYFLVKNFDWFRLKKGLTKGNEKEQRGFFSSEYHRDNSRGEPYDVIANAHRRRFWRFPGYFSSQGLVGPGQQQYYRDSSRTVLPILMVIVSYAALYFEFFIIRTLYYHSQWSLDITANITFSPFKIFSLLIFVLNAVVYFLLAHAIYHLLLKFTKGNIVHLAIAFSLGTLIFVTIGHLMEFHVGVIVVVNFLYFVLLVFFDLPASFKEIRYQTFLYFFVSALASAVVGAFAVYTFEQTKNINAKNQIANQLLMDNDIRGEYLLAEAMEKIQQDLFIKNRLYSPFYSKEIIEQKIRRVYLNNYLDRYDIQIYLFNAQGMPYNNYQVPGISVFIDAFAHEQYETDYPGIYFINEASIASLKRYLSFINITRYGNTIGYILLDLKLKKIIPNTVYPELLVDKRFVQPYSNENYSYAIFQDGKIINNAGNFNFQKDFSEDLLKNKALTNEGINFMGYHHLGISGSDGKLIIVSSELYPIRNILANFSCLFLILVFVTSLLILINTFYKGRGRVNLNFSSKIQLYLNLAFFLPLLIVSVSTLSLLSSSYRKDIIQRYNQRAESISTNIVSSLDNFTKNQYGRERLSNELAQIARYSESDINLFSTNGRLISTSQPTIYENDLLSEYINPDALAIIKEQNNDRVILEEQVGSFTYKSAYVAVKSFETGELMGILSIPFFESQYELEEELIDVLTNIMNVFTFIFIIILIVSYFASKALTYPLKYITQKIKRTSLSAYNEPLVWKSDDEIGLLVGEYNRMLENLEESKKALSQSEKESAWREMAKQVAHEIKNPLTPMKLTLQHLKRILNDEKDTHAETVEKSINTLLQQIETLSDIATSFSSFAQMPTPRQERFELIAVIKKIVTLFSNETEAAVNLQLSQEEVFVEGDKQLMGRIFSNLIINGIQSVPSSRSPEIRISVETVGRRKVRIAIVDNGEGIADAIKDKVFVPNFSTKYAGSGIGLAIAKKGIEHAGGAIWFETSQGVGTTFLIELPLIE